MSYQVLARKWRPQRFNDVVGQQYVLSALENSLREKRLHHAYLFSGTRGVGKTSIARLFAKGLNCEKGITDNPCGICSHCKAIEEGRFIDLIEIDAASRTKVEDTRELLDNVQYKPTIGRFKVYLIDEVHMLSRHSFNALLKTLEEPPEYVKFLLATTDPQKLPITILSRCIQFHLRALSQNQIAEHLMTILQAEKISYETIAVQKISKFAQGSIRDALSLTDQAIAMSNGNITLDCVSQMLGLMNDNQPLELVQSLAQADGQKAMDIIHQVAMKGVDWQQVLSDTAEVLHQIAMIQLLPQSPQDETQLHFLAKQISPEDVQFFYQLMLMGKKELPFAPEQRSGVEMTILKALAFHPKKIISSHLPHSATLPAQAQTMDSTPIHHHADTFSHSNQQLSAPQSALKALKEEQIETIKKEKIKENNAQIPQQAVSYTPDFAHHTNQNEITSPALEAIKARHTLREKQKQIQAGNEEEKKKSELIQSIAGVQKNTASSIPTEENTIQSEALSKDNSKEDYRWTWLNPELENQSESAKPSDIKQAILQERTPELVAKMIQLSCEQDEWSRIVNELDLGGLSRQLALNSYLMGKNGNQLQLGLQKNMLHLDRDETRKGLSEALDKQNLTFILKIPELQNEEHKTPLELRRAIFEKLTQEAKTALLTDEKLKNLLTTFEAEIDESTIRAIVNE